MSGVLDHGPIVTKANNYYMHSTEADSRSDARNSTLFAYIEKQKTKAGFDEKKFWDMMAAAGKIIKVSPSASSSASAGTSLLDPAAFDAEATCRTLSGDFKTNLSAHKSLLYGATVSQVVGACMKAIVEARRTGDAKQIIMDSVLAVFCAFTISAEIHKMYNTHCRTGIWKEFEIKGLRKGATAKDAWVSDSSMNATALKLLGQVIAASASPTSSLGVKAAEVGTIFKPVVNESEYGKLTTATAKALTTADKAAQLTFARTCANLVKIVEHLLENGGNNLSEVEAEMDGIASTVI